MGDKLPTPPPGFEPGTKRLTAAYNALEITVVDNNEQFANPQCVYILVGSEQVMG